MAAAQLAGRANEFMRRHRRLHSAAAHLSAPVRRTAVPVLFGNGRGLRVRTGPSTMMRLVSVVEADVEKTLLDLLGPGDVAYDIGANIGWFSLLAARKVGPSGGVIAFEPSLANVEFLRHNAASNRLDNLTILPTAVGDRDGWASFAEDSSLKGKLSEGGSQCVPLLSILAKLAWELAKVRAASLAA